MYHDLHKSGNAYQDEMQLLDVIRSLYQYNVWANHRILVESSKLTLEQFLAPAGLSYPSIRDIMVHTMGAEWIWLSRWKGTSPSAMFEAIDFPNLLSIQMRWEPIELETQQFIGQLNPLQLGEVVSYVNTRNETWAYPLWQQMIHQVNHATQHRSECAVILSHFSFSPGDLDFLVYQDELNSGSKEME
jgi:uncharacterized damage-inducible protein DinB